ncbi:hypothetical protein BCR44DRAFT_1422884 [Catenaria anguillulae PL171]|uniref:Cns1/TTC4 wheel domain-containing protein n=1 Tax=Catenaria anguillulae PL171 TaxID=765915 RepID=A0A1Y2I7I8_9FUNG|nr:hypothetical protein BCR44DRAFT_1422884 [Catenaria anguillulae PL171]
MLNAVVNVSRNPAPLDPTRTQTMTTSPTPAAATPTGDLELDIIEAIAKARIGPDGQPIKPSWALSEDKWEEELNSVPLFMRSLPDTADESNPELSALQSLIYDGTPEEIAENFKNQGNEMFRDGRKHFPHAIRFYTQGIDQQCSDNKLNATLYCNRAAVHIEMGNFRKCVNDCIAAIKLNPALVKAYYRMGRAYTKLDKFDEAVAALSRAITLDPENGTVKVALEEAQKKLDEASAQQADRLRQQELQAEVDKLVAQAIERAGIKTATLATHVPAAEYASHRPIYDVANDSLSFPCLVLYPEFNQSDFITHFDIGSTFLDQLRPILDEAGAAPWDPEHTYKTSTTDVYFLTFDTDPNKRRLVKVGKKLSLHTVLKSSWSRVVNGVVEFLVLHRDNKFCNEYVEKYRARAGK